MGHKLFIAGVGPGSADLISPAAYEIIKAADVLIGGERNLEAFEQLNKERLVIGSNLEEICSYIRRNAACKKIVVLVSGDPGLYSMMGYLERKLENIDLQAVPGISSLQYLCSKLRLGWNDMYITSVHGRKQKNLACLVRENEKTAIFTGGDSTPDVVCRELLDKGLDCMEVTVGENLSYPEERIISGSLQQIAGMNFQSLSIMILRHCKKHDALNGWKYTTPGIPDSMFIRREVPMTKEEIRVVSLAKLRLESSSIVYDIGAGTGSVSIECARLCPTGRVYAVERDKEAVALIKENIDKFNIGNITVLDGCAPSVMEGLPCPDRVFIGGSGGNMEQLLDWVCCNSGRVRVVINSVTIESTYEAIENLEKMGFKDIDIVSLSVSRSRKAGSKHLMQALNPVYVISGER